MTSSKMARDRRRQQQQQQDKRIEKVYVLYGSQTGNSEQWAKDFCSQIPEKLSPLAIQRWTRSTPPPTTPRTIPTTTTNDDDDDNNTNYNENITEDDDDEEIHVEAIHMQLDDFLEIEKCSWTRLIVIFTSSYGNGQAPLGCYRFRDLCDAWYEEIVMEQGSKGDSSAQQQQDGRDSDRAGAGVHGAGVLQGVSYALCGLGDSKFKTSFHNPTRIDEALQSVGATRVGPLGQADASGTGDDSQGKVIEEWIDNIWIHLAKVIIQPPLPPKQLHAMQLATVEICRKINPDFVDDDNVTTKTTTTNQTWMVRVFMNTYSLAMVVAVLAIGLYAFNKSFQFSFE